MGQLLVAVLPLALGAAVSPTLLALQLLVLSGPTHRLARAWALTLGAALVLGAFSFLCVTALQHVRPHHSHKSAADAAVLIGSGLLLGALAVRSRIRRPTPGEKHTSKTATRLTTARTPWFVGVGAFGMVVNFSTLLLVLPAVHEITRSAVATPDKVAAFVLMYLIILVPVLVPVLLATILGSRADRALDVTHRWVGRNARTIGTVIEAVFAVYLLGKGIRAVP
ncbi:MAG TPA: GAP family protein [Acidimicrobiales bacterium]